MAQGRGTGGDSGAAGSRGQRGEPRAAAGSCLQGLQLRPRRGDSRGYRERHTPRRAGPHGRAHHGPSARAAAAPDRESSEERGSRTPDVAAAREVPARPRSGPVTFQRLEDRLRHLGAAAVAAPPGGARRPPRTHSAGEVGEAPGAWGSCSTRGAAGWHCDSPRSQGTDRPAAAPALFGLPARPPRPRPPAHDRAVPGQAHSGAHYPYGAGGRDAPLGPHWL